MNADEYVRSKAEQALVEAFVEYHHYHRVEHPYATQDEAERAARKLLARVKRDSAREALDGLADTVRAEHGVRLHVVTRYRDTRYPEGDL